MSRRVRCGGSFYFPCPVFNFLFIYCTVTVAVAVVEPPEIPVQVAVNIVVAVSRGETAVLLVACEPIWRPVGSVTVQLAAFSEVHEIFEGLPLFTLLGLAMIDTTGFGTLCEEVAGDCT
jgi:hypothetical protein